MTKMPLTNTRLINGMWEGLLSGAAQTKPDLKVSHLGNPVDGLRLQHEPAHDAWRVEVPIPAHLISEGVQTFIIHDAKGQTLGSFALLAGDVLSEDIRAEVDLLRAELDMLKRTFRQHCRDR